MSPEAEEKVQSEKLDAELVEESDNIDWEALREWSIKTGGLGKDRETIWPRLLYVEESLTRRDVSTTPSEPHRDERQIKLDTERSFVLYSVEEHECNSREELQRQLHKLLVSMFRKRPKLNYFQGYHDIITVLFLTLPKEVQLASSEKLSLHRLRDSMGSSLEPVLGQLRILQRLLRLADSQYAALLDNNSPLPYFALSNLLTLFSHDIPTLPLIQHIFDYLLTRPPIASIYLAAVIILSRKEEVIWLEREGEEGMLHSLLSSLPDIYEEGAVDPSEEPKADDQMEIKQEVDNDSLEGTRSTTATEADNLEQTTDAAEAPVVSDEHQEAALPLFSESSDSHTTEDVSLDPDDTLQETKDGQLSDADFSREETLVASSPPAEDPKVIVVDPLKEEEVDKIPNELDEKADSPPLPSSPASSTNRPRRAKITLTSLLSRADYLYSLYPPTHPSLALSTTMGPQSVLFTWSQDPTALPDDDDAEAMVLHPELVVLPYIEPEDEEDSHEKERRRRRKLKKPRRFAGVVVERRVMLAGAVLVLGVAMAVYGIRAAPEQSMGRHQWRRAGRWVGGMFVGASERILDGLRF